MRNRKTVLANRTIYTLIWFDVYDLRLGNGVGHIISHSPHEALLNEIRLDKYTSAIVCDHLQHCDSTNQATCLHGGPQHQLRHARALTCMHLLLATMLKG